jgi:cytochrome c oxidase cbb3-type subunit 1
VFWGYQLFIVMAATGYLLGSTQGQEYAEPEWLTDLWLTIVWVAFLAVYVGTLLKRKEPHIYVANWFLLSFIVTVAMLHVVNNLQIPVSFFGSSSVVVMSGVQNAMTQWWYGHNAVGFFLTAGFLGMMYYFIPKQAERPVYSYKLSIIHFWALIFLYIWAGPHHLHYTALPDWASTLGMVFSVVLWMPSWGGMINGLMTLSGAWDKLRTDPVLRMMVTSVAFYGMSTFEGPMMSIRAVNSLSHYTDWTIGHVHSGALGWNGMITFGMLYYLFPKLWNRSALQPQGRVLALLARHHRHRALRRVDVGHRYHGRPDVARSRRARVPRELLRRHRGREVPDVCGPWSGRCDVPHRCPDHGLEPLDDRDEGEARKDAPVAAPAE